ncbi:MAG: FMN phosphatase YigB (HAD superfamily), partial [Halieaceae bacterium]
MATNRQIKTISFDLDNTLWDIDSVMHRATEVQDQWLCVHRPKVVELLPPDEMFAFKKQFLRNN